MKMKQRGLGKGLDALLNPMDLSKDSAGITHLKIDQIKPNKNQPRTTFSEKSLNELAQSINEQGLLQPILVRKLDGENYEIVAGERRWRACQLAKLERVPVIIKNLSNEEVLVIALIENIQREDLNPIDQALALKKLKDDLNISQEEIAKKVGKSRAQIANLLRLLQLPEDVQHLLKENKLSAGHARALLALESKEEMIALANEIISKGMSVRETEKIVQNKKITRKTKRKVTFDKELANFLAQQFQNKISPKIKVNLKGNREKGTISLKYNSQNDLELLLNKLGISSDER
ncbi:ParB/RepB/Spo0J family partition protein [Desulfohalobiaceae bacterium Ax17]|jgi:ParB family chromosome partitioning protein|uniref:ParB/RepB/Spo0J family partition protein n=1 Tax=Desulfovulcanus ferrireducens TaxID=2831190 RepID=UPI00207BC436|nr:ParB/RepB/Spo0J family partition protein [Desulfovulcanus ferrireducens]MBT8763474.1 ParB/RepB/Spo0J family partition protein [Desulfovulcanus ferrireducens]